MFGVFSFFFSYLILCKSIYSIFYPTGWPLVAELGQHLKKGGYIIATTDADVLYVVRDHAMSRLPVQLNRTNIDWQDLFTLPI